MTRILKKLLLAVTLAVVTAASAVSVRITDRDLQGLLGYGESTTGKLVLQLASNASGPVTVFVNDGKNITSHRAVIRNGQIIMDDANGTTLTKFLATRGINLTVAVVDTDSSKDKSFSLPGLQDIKDVKDNLPGKVKKALP